MDLQPLANVRPDQTELTGTRNALSSDFETFLVMLTTQMENQDPLNPVESSDFAVQLATFSGVEQQVRTNELLASLSASSSIADLASWVGLDARVEGPVQFDGRPVRIDTGTEITGTTRQLVVRSETGALIRSDPLGREIGVIDWVGTDQYGNPLPAGNYSLSVEHRSGDDVVDTTPVASFARIVESRRAGAGTELVLSNGDTVAASSVEALRAPAVSDY